MTAATSQLILDETALENRFFKVSLNRATGTVSSIYDKQFQREWVDSEASHQLNQLVTRWVVSGKQESPVKARIERVSSGPVCASLRVTTEAPGCPQVIQDITLIN